MSEHKELKISGMTCAGCVASIEKAVRKVDGVNSVNVNLGDETARIAVDPGKDNDEEIERVISDLGYSIVRDSTEIQIGGMHCASCVSTLERVLGGLDGVRAVTVNLNSESANIIHDPVKTSISDMKEAIKEAGYEFLGLVEDGGLDAAEKVQQADLKDKKWRFSVGLVVGFGLFFLMFVLPPSELLAWITLIVSTPAFVYSGFTIFKAAFISLKNRTLNMDVMYAMGMGVAFVASILGTTGILTLEFLFFDSAVMLAGFLMLGRFLESKAKGKTSEAIKKLMTLQAKEATVIRDGTEQVILAEDIKVGDTVVVKPGEKVPADGEISKGSSHVDESMVTGEPIPVLKGKGDLVYGGTINKNAVLHFKARKVGKDTMISQIIKLVREAQGSKPPIQKLADAAVTYFIPVVLAIALGTFFVYLISGFEFITALTILITILVIACPCALGLATPTAVTVGIGRGAELGILIRNGEVLEKARDLDTMLFDKTGTLTIGKPVVTDAITMEGFPVEDRAKMLQIAASIEHNSQHPLAEAIENAAIEREVDLGEVEHFNTVEGKGVVGVLQGQEIHVGNLQFLQDAGITVSQRVKEKINALEAKGKTVVLVGKEKKVTGIIGISDTIRDTAKPAIMALEKMGIKSIMVTGDNEITARTIADEIGINDVKARVLPAEKAGKVKELQEEGHVLGFTGDGINDAPALAQADVGIAMGGGTDVAIDSGEIIIMKDDPLDVVAGVQLSRRVLKQIKLNLFWAFIYNIILIPVAIFGLFAPEFAGLAMAMSSVTVVSFSLLMKRYTPSAYESRETSTSDPSPGSAQEQSSSPHEMQGASEEDNNGKVLECQHCDATRSVPHHCGKPMHVEEVAGQEKLTCWMGPDCGKQDIPTHCGSPMEITTRAPIDESTGRESTETKKMNGYTKGDDTMEEKRLACESCDETMPVPMHCGKPMHVEEVDGVNMLVCWMGPDCGKQEIPEHHGEPMHVKE
ncbi:heavy metal translocating P-type ATPase [Candidatus Bathyarchaeota archaeon]|nr:heavy metal translocating P-type ATPase [Candidatus Bathyarchaeota archaeon]